MVWYTELLKYTEISDGFQLLLFLLGRVQVLKRAYSCPWTILTQSYCLPFTVFVLQVIVNLLYSHILEVTKKDHFGPLLISPSDLICIARTSLYNSVSLMAYNVVYTSIPVLTTVLDMDLSEKTVTQTPEILLYRQAGRLLNPSTFAGWFGRLLYHAIVVFLISLHAYANERSWMGLSMVALSVSIWLQAFAVTLEMK